VNKNSSYEINSQYSAIKTKLKGQGVLSHPILNKETAFAEEERSSLKLNGLVPTRIETLQEQSARTYERYKSKATDLSRHIFLRELQDRNETLFYRLLVDHMGEMLPMLYTPIVAFACQKFSEIYRRARGLFISFPDREKIEEMVENIDLPDVKVIVVSDGGRVLGLGDQGIGGMGIAIGKITLYSACGGIYPGVCLPVILDVGTDNEEKLADPFYFGWRHRRIEGKEYDQFIDRFVQAIMKKYPKVLLQWEDFGKNQARSLLDRYRDHCCTFNDDIQGTAAIALAGILTGLKINREELFSQQIVIYGSGSAGTGIGDEIVNLMSRSGLSKQEAYGRIWMFNRQGLIHTGMDRLSVAQVPYAQNQEKVLRTGLDATRKISLEEVMEKVKPSVLIGVSGSAGAFSEKAITTMAQFCKRPIIFPLSNPTSHSEATPEDLMRWTEGRAHIATGTQFPDVTWNGAVYKISQCNNYYIFPAMGLAVLSGKATRITSEMFLVAAEALSSFSPILKQGKGGLFPDLTEIRAMSKSLALIIAKQAIKENVAPEMSDAALRQAIEEMFWEPAYSKVESL